MARYLRAFVITDVAAVHLDFDRLFTMCAAVDAAERRAGLRRTTTGTLAVAERAYLEFNRGLDRLARETAQLAEKSIKERIEATRTRKNTGKQPHLRNHVKARPLRTGLGRLATGAVGIGDLGWLDRVRNPIGEYGPYWRAQEYGSGSLSEPDEGQKPVPSQRGRVIRGLFYGSGYAGGEKPNDQYKGGGGPHPLFVSTRQATALFGGLGFSGGSGKQGGKPGGFGTISVELAPRHFIRDGADLAKVDWLVNLQRIQGQAQAALAALR